MTAPHTQQVKAIDTLEKSAIKKSSSTAKGLSKWEKRTAMEIIKKRQKQGKLDPKWTANFMKVLTTLKAEEVRFKPK